MIVSMTDNIQFDIVEGFPEQSAEPKPTNPFQTLVLEYLSKNSPCVYILTPCFGSVCLDTKNTCLKFYLC